MGPEEPTYTVTAEEVSRVLRMQTDLDAAVALLRRVMEHGDRPRIRDAIAELLADYDSRKGGG